MSTTAIPDFDGSGLDHRRAATSAETEIRTLVGGALSNAIVNVERGQTADGLFPPSLRQACHAARQHGLRAEQLLVIVKASWAEKCPDRVLSRQQAAFALERIITVCIQEFYRNDND